jgi:hypothetical protein
MLLESSGRADAETQNIPAVIYALEPRPTKILEDGDNDRYENEIASPREEIPKCADLDGEEHN